MTSLARLIRSRGFHNWVIRTGWPVFMLAVMEPNIIGALVVTGFLRFGLPPEHRVLLRDLPQASLPFFIAVVLLALTAESLISLKLLIPVFRWQRRHDESLSDDNAVASEFARARALKMPFYRSLISAATWCVGGVILIIPIWGIIGRFVPVVVVVAAALGATAASIIGYLQAERVLRQGVPEHIHPSGVILRTVLTWLLSTGVPVLAIVMMIATTKASILQVSAEELFMPILLLAIAALASGLFGTMLTAMSIADPLRQLRWALGEVQRGNYATHMPIYDASQLGVLQGGFNDMVQGLADRQRLRDLFGRYVGEDVARRALEGRPQLGGQERNVAVLFVDLVGSTKLAATRPPVEIVDLLNEFFRIVVETVNHYGGFVNKFQGDGALAIFGAPLEHPDGPGAALAAARELHDELIEVLGTNEFGIGVAAGRAIAGHIGAQARFEYTVIGDPVNEPPGSPSWPSRREDTCWRRRSRSAARWTPRRCAGTSARSSSCADALPPPSWRGR